MKKFYQIITLCAITFAIVSCGGNDLISDSSILAEQSRTACASGDFEKSHNILAILHAKYLKSKTITYNKTFDNLYSGEAWTACAEGCKIVEAIAEEYTSAVQFVFTSEARTIIAESDNPEDKIIYLYTEMLPIGDKDATSYPETAIYNKYAVCVNSFSNSVLDLAINTRNKRLAAIAVSHFLDVIVKKGYEDAFLSDKERVAAQEKFDNAEKNGLFD